MSDATGKLWHLVQFCDSALPVGGFSFSAALESAAGYGVVEDEPTLKSYAQATLNQMLKSDCVAALHTLRKGNIEEALLADRELNMAQLAEKLGYNDQYHFIRQFKAMTGMTPGSYRKKQS